jgi:DNA-binding transcriptional ArsR family regulator
MHESELTGDQLLQALNTLANPHRLRVVAALRPGRQYVSELARALSISRPLLQMHLRKLQAAGLVTAQLELAGDGKAVNYYSLTPFVIRLSPDTIARAVHTLTDSKEGQ